MPQPFLSEIRLMSFVFPPKGWALCDGQLLPINRYQALFSLLGTTYGGDGRTNFALPDFRNRTPIHAGGGHTIGEKGGQPTQTLSIAQLPTHIHTGMGSGTNADAPVPGESVLAAANNVYTAAAALTPIEPSTLAPVGGSQPHTNAQPYLVLSYCIALEGIFPSPN
jgi:microcystin-dependent protein